MLRPSKKSRSQINNLDSPCPPGRQIKIWSLGNQVHAPISRTRSHNFEEWDSRAGGRCVIIFINFKSDPLSFSTFSNPTNFHHSSWTCPTLSDTISIYLEQDPKRKKMISIYLFATHHIRHSWQDCFLLHKQEGKRNTALPNRPSFKLANAWQKD